MLINLRNALMTGKPLPYDAEVEYVTNLSGRATITTDIYHNTANKVEFGVMLPPASGGQYLGTFRAYSNEQTATTRVIRNGTNTGSILVNHGTIAGGGGTTMSVANADTVLWGWTKAGEANINGVSATLSQPAVQTLSVPFEFFYTQTAGRIYHFKVENQCDLIPVRKNGAGYLYDRMSGKMYGSDSGVLSTGADVVPVEYIESHGTEYINLGILNFSAFSVGLKPKDKATPHYNTAYLGWNNNGSRTTGVYADTVGTFTIRNNSNATVTATPQTWDMFHDILYSNRVVSVDGAQYSLVMTASTAYDFGLFSIIKPNAIPSKCAISYFNAKDQNANDILGMKPIRVGTGSTWEGAMMDTLTRRIYRNAGTGAFLYGNDLKYPIPSE